MRIGLLSDAHGNLGGFTKGIQILKNANVDDIWYLGDSVGYIPGLEVLDRIIDYKINMILGNHEYMLLNGIPRQKDQIYRLEDTKQSLTSAHIEFLLSLKDHHRMTIDNKELLMIHGSPDNFLFGYVYPDSTLKDFYTESADVIIMGNTHYPFERIESSKVFVNVGSCGLPRDTSKMGKVAVFDTISGNVDFLEFSLSDFSNDIINKKVIHPSVEKKLISYI